MTGSANLEVVVKAALKKFFDAAVEEEWRGREREAVSLFAFEFLVPYAGRSALGSASQIGIECAVPQVTADGKKQVCKDLVIWPRPRMTVWDQDRRPTQSPSLILEWKVGGYPRRATKTIEQMMEVDVMWLKEFTSHYRSCCGIAIGIQWAERPRLRAVRVIEGSAKNGWWMALG